MGGNLAKDDGELVGNSSATGVEVLRETHTSERVQLEQVMERFDQQE